MSKNVTNFLVLSNPLTWVGAALVVGMAMIVIYALLLKMLWDTFADGTPIESVSVPTTVTVTAPTPTTTTVALAAEPVIQALKLAETAGVVTPVVTPPNIAELSHQQLLDLAKERGIKGVNDRWKKETLLKKMVA